MSTSPNCWRKAKWGILRKTLSYPLWVVHCHLSTTSHPLLITDYHYWDVWVGGGYPLP